MDAGWWTAVGAGSRVTPDFSSASVLRAYPNDLWDEVGIDDITAIYQRDYHYGATYPRENGGYFYLDSTGDDITMAADCVAEYKEDTAADGIYPQPQSREEIKQLGEMNRDGKVIGPAAWHWPFCCLYDDDRYKFEVFFRSSADGAGDHDLRHYQPYAWYGYPADVIASIVLQLGLDEDFIDTDAFDTSYDDQSDGGNTYKTKVGYAREVGVQIIESLKEIASHSGEMFGFNMKGQVTMPARTTPTATTTALEGIKSGGTTWRYTTDHQYNDVLMTAGMASLTTVGVHGPAPTEISETPNEEITNADYVFKSEWDATLASAQADRWEYSYAETGSQNYFGIMRLSGDELSIDGPLVVNTAPTHRRLFGGCYTGTRLIAALMAGFDYPLREVTVVQDFRGLDYDVGHKVTDVAITADGETIADMRCIHKEIDFDNMTVTSVLLEEDSGSKSKAMSGFSDGFSHGFGG